MKPTSNWHDVIPVHPAADLFPMMGPEDLQALADDIRANGLLQPIVFYERRLLDGRNRLDALELAGFRFGVTKDFEVGCFDPDDKWVELPTEFLHDIDPAAFVISVNIRRRHLTAEQKRDLIAKLIKANPERSDRATAKLAQADNKTVAAVREKLEATEEIPQLDKRVGADGKARQRASKRTPASAQPEPDIGTPVSAEPPAAVEPDLGATVAEQKCHELELIKQHSQPYSQEFLNAILTARKIPEVERENLLYQVATEWGLACPS